MVEPEPDGATSASRSTVRVDGSRLAFLTIQAIVLFNAVFHEPTIGYDAPAHIDYLRTLATFRLPTPPDSYEFFSPPLPYLIPSLVLASGWLTTWGAAKCAQLLTVLY